MLAGHYAAALAAKGADPKLPLWLLFLAAQCVDIIWGLLVLTGVEQVSLDYELPSNPLVAESMPYSHSLAASAFWAALAGLLAMRWFGSRRRGAIVAAVVLAHWFFDLLMHRPDLTLAGGDPAFGLQLWNYPLIAHSFEIGVLLLAYLAYRHWAKPGPSQNRGVVILLIILVAVQFYSILAPPPPNVTQMTVSLLAVWLGLACLAAWVETRADRL